MNASLYGVNVEIPLLSSLISNWFYTRTLHDGQFDWGGHLLKRNGGVQR